MSQHKVAILSHIKCSLVQWYAYAILYILCAITLRLIERKTEEGKGKVGERWGKDEGKKHVATKEKRHMVFFVESNIPFADRHTV